MAYVDKDKLTKELSMMYKSPTSAEDFMAVGYDHAIADVVVTVHEQPTLEPLTDKEQRIFLAAMGREKKVCEEVDAEMTREPYEDSLVRVCREIERKVKKALWTN